jgi:hypothetical protein
MRKSAIKPTDIVQPANSARTENNATGYPANRSRSKCSGRQPSSWPFRPEDANPLAWWRTMPADLLRDAEQLLLRETIREVGVLKGCEWVSAMRGDVPAGIAIALEAMPITTITIEVDLAISGHNDFRIFGGRPTPGSRTGRLTPTGCWEDITRTKFLLARLRGHECLRPATRDQATPRANSKP